MSVEVAQEQTNVSRNGADALGGPIEAGVERNGSGGFKVPAESGAQGRGNSGEVIPLEIERSGSDTSRVEIGNDARFKEALDDGPVELDLGGDYNMTLERTDSGEIQATLQTPEQGTVSANASVTESGDLAVDLSLAASEHVSLEASLENNRIDAGGRVESGDFEGSVTRESNGDVVAAGSINGPDGEASARVRFGDGATDAQLSGSFTVVDGETAELTLSGETDFEETLRAGGELDVKLGDNVDATIYADTDGVLKANIDGEVQDVSFSAGYDSTTGTARASIAVQLPDDVTVSAGVDGGSPRASVEVPITEGMTAEGGYSEDRGAYAEVEGRVTF